MKVTKEERDELRRYYESGRPSFPDPSYLDLAGELAIRLLDELEAAEKQLAIVHLYKED